MEEDDGGCDDWKEKKSAGKEMGLSDFMDNLGVNDVDKDENYVNSSGVNAAGDGMEEAIAEEYKEEEYLIQR